VSWWRPTDLEDTRSLEASEDLPQRIDRLERAFATELTGSMSLNIRGTALAAASAVALLLLAQFSAVWLDDNSWHIPDIPDKAMQLLLVATAVALAGCVLVAVIAVWPRRRWASELRDRIERLNEGADLEEAKLLLGMVDKERAANERKSRLLRVAAIPFLAAVLGTVAQGTIFALAAEPADPRRASEPAAVELDESGLPSPEDQLELARTYAPRVWLHHDERFGPLDPGAFVRGSRLAWHTRRRDTQLAGRGQVAPARLGRRCDAAAGGCYTFAGFLSRELTRPFHEDRFRPPDLNPRRGFALDLDKRLRRGQSRRDPDVPVFFELRRTPDELLLAYWFSYGYSTPHVGGSGKAARVLRDQLSHEGDWEGIDVALSPDGGTPLAVYFYGHGTPVRRRWDEVCKAGPDPADCSRDEAGHPVVYSALDSHASYADRGTTKVCGEVGCSSDIRTRGFRWDTWARPDRVRPVRGEPWFGFGGAWGAAGPIRDRTGPLGPSRWKLPADPDPGDLSSVPD
jgi:hypothetical protein